MVSNKIVIIGGSMGGASVAARLRRLDENAKIVLLDRNQVISYAVSGIPYFLGGVVKDESSLQLNSIEEYSKLINVDVRSMAEVFSINRENKAIIVRDLTNGKVYEETYDKLVLAPGSMVDSCQFEGRFSKHIFSVRSREQGLALKHYIANNNCKRALIVGAGLNGLEFAENLHRLGITISLLESSNQILPGWDPEMSALVQRRLWDKKVRVVLHDRIASVKQQDVVLASGKQLKADIIVLAVGTSPNVLLAQECGLELGPRGGLRVNSGMLTNDSNIYALGDAVELDANETEPAYTMPLSGPAYKQARVVADNLNGKHVSYVDPPRNIVIKLFDMSVALTGSNESQLKQNDIKYNKSYAESHSLARYYPNTRSMIIKLLFGSNTGTILGAQIVGGTGVDKRIDVIATAMQMGLSVDQLKDLNLCFAPPFSGERDPVNVAGMVASNIRSNRYNVLHWSDLETINFDTVTLIDVRSAQDYKNRTLSGAINIPVEDLRQRLNEIPKDKLTIVFCNYGKKGYFAHNILRQCGFDDVYNINGGLTVFQLGNLSFKKKVTKENRIETETTAQSNAPILSNTVVNSSAIVENQQVATEQQHIDVPVMENPIFSEPPSLHDSIPVLQLEPKTHHSQVLEKLALPDAADESPPVVSNVVVTSDTPIIEVDASGLNCPGPIMKLAKTMNNANAGDIVRIIATDSSFGHDVKTWCEKKGYRLLEYKNSHAKISAVLLKC